MKNVLLIIVSLLLIQSNTKHSLVSDINNYTKLLKDVSFDYTVTYLLMDKTMETEKGFIAIGKSESYVSNSDVEITNSNKGCVMVDKAAKEIDYFEKVPAGVLKQKGTLVDLSKLDTIASEFIMAYDKLGNRVYTASYSNGKSNVEQVKIVFSPDGYLKRYQIFYKQSEYDDTKRMDVEYSNYKHITSAEGYFNIERYLAMEDNGFKPIGKYSSYTLTVHKNGNYNSLAKKPIE